MIAAAGVSQVQCADYATYGTLELGERAKALEGRGVPAREPGLVALGATLKKR